MNQYRDELAKPYLTDSVFLENLAKETYERMKQEYDVKHIMRPRNRIDSLTNVP